MKVLELFAGTRSIGKAFEAKGHQVFSIDWNPDLPNINLCCNILDLSSDKVVEIFGHPDIIWASPDCTTYSVAAIGKHRVKQYHSENLIPLTDYAKMCDSVNSHVVNLIKELHPKYYFIENPRGGLRKMSFMKGLPRYTVTYCQYGESRMKPTDIWTNHPCPNFKPPCKNGDKCHVPAPRGSVTGTQGIKGKLNRAIIPELLCKHIVDICEVQK